MPQESLGRHLFPHQPAVDVAAAQRDGLSVAKPKDRHDAEQAVGTPLLCRVHDTVGDLGIEVHGLLVGDLRRAEDVKHYSEHGPTVAKVRFVLVVLGLL